jgi:hypothetical protein
VYPVLSPELRLQAWNAAEAARAAKRGLPSAAQVQGALASAHDKAASDAAVEAAGTEATTPADGTEGGSEAARAEAAWVQVLLRFLLLLHALAHTRCT